MNLRHHRYNPLTRVAVTAAFLIALAATAVAHAVVMESTPADGSILSSSPADIKLRFDAMIEKKLTRLSLSTGGKKIPLTPPATNGDPPDTLTIPLPHLSPGTYTLQFRVLATDGHATPGIIRFTITGP